MMRFAVLLLIVLMLLPAIPAAGQKPAPAQPGLVQRLADLPAPPPFDPEEKTTAEKERPEEFTDEDNVPPDDAPIEDLLAYWSNYSGSSFPTQYKPAPSSKTLDRLIEHFEDNPDKLPSYIGIFPAKPEWADKIKAIYDAKVNSSENPGYGYTQIREWLKFNSRYFVDELITSAHEIKDENNYVQNPNQYVLRALAKVDWSAAQPIIQRLENDTSNPYSRILAKWVTYQHAQETGDSSTESSYRSELQKIVEDKSQTYAARDLAMDALAVEKGWDGREDWYLTLLEDESLLKIQDNGYTGLTTMINLAPRKNWTEKMIELTKSTSINVRSAAARNLMTRFKKGDKAVLEALIPWLNDANWAKSSRNNERASLIASYAETLVPEAVPSLVAIVMNDEDNRITAATALIPYKDRRAVNALRMVLATREGPEERNMFIAPLLASGGFSGDEQMSALEAYATLISTEAGEEYLNNYRKQFGDGDHHYEEEEEGSETPAKPVKPIPLNLSVGNFLAEMEEPPEELVVRAIARVKILRRSNPVVAAIITDIMSKWKGKAMYIESLRRIGSGETDTDNILFALVNREAIRDTVPSEVNELKGIAGTPRGISSCIAEDNGDYSAILSYTDVQAQMAMLACARLIRAPLPAALVGPLLNSPNPELTAIAERFLESEDSLEARKMILARHKGAAMILGGRTAFFQEGKTGYSATLIRDLFRSVTGGEFHTGNAEHFRKLEDGLRKEISTSESLMAVYGLFTNTNQGHHLIRLFNNRISYTYYENDARLLQRDLSAEEYKGFYDYLLSNNVDGMKPQIGECEEKCDTGEFVMFGRDGGRRVFFNSGAESLTIERIRDMMETFRNGDVQLAYNLGDKTSALEVLFAGNGNRVGAVWKNGADLRFALEPTDEGDGSWRSLQDGKLTEPKQQPAEVPYLYDQTQVALTSELQMIPRAWQVRSGATEIRAGSYDEQGLFRVTLSGAKTQIKENYYSTVRTSADGKWAIAEKAPPDAETMQLVRINLQTGREFVINLPVADAVKPVAFINGLGKFLIYRGRDRDFTGEDEDYKNYSTFSLTPKVPEYYLLDPVTGAMQRLRGEVRPIEHQTFRPLQPASGGLKWAAIYNEKTKASYVGKYSDTTLAFKPVMSIPNARIDSMDIWVDEPGGRVYFVYEGHLLALPLK